MTEQNVAIKAKSPSDEYHAIKERSLLFGAFIASILGSVIFIIQIINSLQTGQVLQLIGIGIAYIGLLLLTFLRKIKFELRLYGLVGIISLVGVINLFQTGIQGNSRLYFLFAIFLASLLASRMFAIIYGLAITLIMTVIAANNFLKFIPFLTSVENRGTASEWILGLLTFVLFASITIVLSDAILRRFMSSLSNEETLSKDLDHERNTRNETIREQTAELSKRNQQRDLANQIAKDIASLSDQASLLQKTVDLIRERFDFYHAGVFLLDSNKEFAILSAATGEAGKMMLDQKHKLRAGQEGIVGRVVSSGEPRIALDVGADAIHFRNPLLPETRSEMAIPLKVGDTIIGALDVQSLQESAFVKEDIDILQTIADQLALGIERSRILVKYETTVKALTNVSESITGQAWQRYTQKSGSVISFSVDAEGEKIGIDTPSDSKEAMNSGRIIENKLKVGQSEKFTIAVPLKLFGQSIGSMNLQFNSMDIDNETKEYYAAFADRLAISFENVRKNEDIQIRARNEHMVRELTTKVQSYTSVDDILKTAAAELGKSLGLSEVEVGLLPPTQKKSEG